MVFSSPRSQVGIQRESKPLHLRPRSTARVVHFVQGDDYYILITAEFAKDATNRDQDAEVLQNIFNSESPPAKPIRVEYLYDGSAKYIPKEGEEVLLSEDRNCEDYQQWESETQVNPSRESLGLISLMSTESPEETYSPRTKECPHPERTSTDSLEGVIIGEIVPTQGNQPEIISLDCTTKGKELGDLRQYGYDFGWERFSDDCYASKEVAQKTLGASIAMATRNSGKYVAQRVSKAIPRFSLVTSYRSTNTQRRSRK